GGLFWANHDFPIARIICELGLVCWLLAIFFELEADKQRKWRFALPVTALICWIILLWATPSQNLPIPIDIPTAKTDTIKSSKEGNPSELKVTSIVDSSKTQKIRQQNKTVPRDTAHIEQYDIHPSDHSIGIGKNNGTINIYPPPKDTVPEPR